MQLLTDHFSGLSKAIDPTCVMRVCGLLYVRTITFERNDV